MNLKVVGIGIFALLSMQLNGMTEYVACQKRFLLKFHALEKLKDTNPEARQVIAIMQSLAQNPQLDATFTKYQLAMFGLAGVDNNSPEVRRAFVAAASKKFE